MEFRKFLLLLSVLSYLFFSTSVLAEQWGDFTYTIANGAATITDYTGSGGAVVIPSEIDSNPVVGMGSYLFFNDYNVTSIFIPGSIESIAYSAIFNCTSLTSITVDESNNHFSSLGGVLYDKAKTKLINHPAGKSGSFSIPEGVVSIEVEAFYHCAGLTSLIIPASVTIIRDYAFDYCTGLTSITSSGSALSIGECAFMHCSSLVDISLSGVTSIGPMAFTDCSALTRIALPASLTSIGEHAFYYCSNLTSVYFYGNAPSTGDDIFWMCPSGLIVYYIAGRRGFTNPWNGHTTAMFDPLATTTTTQPTTTTTTQPTTTTTIADEYGNSCAEAMEIGINTSVSGMINFGGDYDYFKLVLPESGSLTVGTTGSIDTLGYLKDDSCADITSDDDSGADLNFLIATNVAAGSYYVAVRHFNSISTGDYMFNVAFSNITTTTIPPVGDADADGIADDVDNCPDMANPQQLDADNDGAGDVCDSSPGCGGCGQVDCEPQPDADYDGTPDAFDNCPSLCNMAQLDADADGIGDVCDTSPGCGGCGQAACEVECNRQTL
jgi:hypothetical protein